MCIVYLLQNDHGLIGGLCTRCFVMLVSQAFAIGINCDRGVFEISNFVDFMDSESRGLPPAHPSLPKAPHIQSSQIQSAVATALANPYSQPSYGQYQPSYSSHYAQAYMQANAPGWSTTPQGYSLSSSYLNGTSTPGPEASSSGSMYTPRLDSRPSPSFNSQSFASSSSTWYQPGDHRCKHNGCSFSGSQKAVEVHMMDRHLIYPPGWEKRKKREDWDADPSLKGYAHLYSNILNSPIM